MKSAAHFPEEFARRVAKLEEANQRASDVAEDASQVRDIVNKELQRELRLSRLERELLGGDDYEEETP